MSDFIIYFEKIEETGILEIRAVSPHKLVEYEEKYQLITIDEDLGSSFTTGNKRLNNWEIKWDSGIGDYVFLEKPPPDTKHILATTLYKVPMDNEKADLIFTRKGDGFLLTPQNFIHDSGIGGEIKFFITERDEPHIMYACFSVVGKELEQMETRYMKIDFTGIPEKYSLFTFFSRYHSYELRYR